MGRAVAVSFEGENVRIVYATLKGNGIVVDDALILKDEQFDDFLQKEKTKEFIVVYDFKNFYQDIILIPPVKNRYVKNLIESEIKKRAPDFKDFSFIYFLHGEKVIENTRMKEIFIFAVKDEILKDIINRFINKGKVIKTLYPSVFSVAGLIQSTVEPLLCVSEVGQNKNLFLLKDGRIQFIRTAQSLKTGINDFDIQNIDMTVNYCRQTLRLNPSSIMLMGSLCRAYNAKMDTLIPVGCLSQPQNVSALKEVFLDFIVPISAFFRHKNINIITSEYKDFYLIRTLLLYSIILLSSLSVIGLGYIGFKIKGISDTKSTLRSIKNNIPDIEESLSIYMQQKSKLQQYMPFVTFINNVNSAPDIQRLLVMLSGLNINNIKIDSLAATVSDNSSKIEIKGTIETGSYADMQASYQNFIDSIRRLKGMNITGQGLELKDKSFRVEVNYKGEG